MFVRWLVACFLTGVEHSFERVDLTCRPWNPVDADFLQTSPLHLLHTATHHMWDQNSFLSEYDMKNIMKRKKPSRDFTLATLLLLFKLILHKGNKTWNWTIVFIFMPKSPFKSRLNQWKRFFKPDRDLLRHSFDGDTEDRVCLDCRAWRFKRVGTVLQGETQLHLLQVQSLSPPSLVQVCRVQLIDKTKKENHTWQQIFFFV